MALPTFTNTPTVIPVKKEGFWWITPEVAQWLEQHEFDLRKDDSYCFGHKETSQWVYHKYLGVRNSWPVVLYISETHVGFDYDYACGGNSKTGVVAIKVSLEEALAKLMESYIFDEDLKYEN